MLVGKHSAQWALDDVLIGMNDSSRTGFHDKFDGATPLRHNWYRIQGGEVTVDCLSLDTALTFNSEAIDSESHKHIHPHEHIHLEERAYDYRLVSCNCVHGKGRNNSMFPQQSVSSGSLERHLTLNCFS